MTPFWYQYLPPEPPPGFAIAGVAISTQNVAIQGNIVRGMAIAGWQVYARTVPPSFDPATIAELILDATTLTGANGTQIDNWQSTGSNTEYDAVPFYGTPVTVSVGKLNGQTVATFPGSAGLTVADFDASNPAGFNIFVLTQLTSASPFYPMCVVCEPSAGAGGWETRGSGSSQLWEQMVPGPTTFDTTIDMDAWHILECIYNKGSGTLSLYSDGTLQSTNSVSIDMTSYANQFLLGVRSDGYGWVGDIACAVAATGDLATSDRQKIEGWIAWKWGVQTQLPATHPYYSSPP